MNLHTKFSENGQKAECNLCSFQNSTPAEHFGSIDIYGKRVDGNPIYSSGTFELKIDIDGQPMLPNYVFLIDISSTAIMSGYFYQSVTTIK
jgi:hypothetical protein